MKEVLIGLTGIGLFLFCYFIVGRLGRFLETTELCREADRAEADVCPAQSPEDAERAGDPKIMQIAGIFRYQYYI